MESTNFTVDESQLSAENFTESAKVQAETLEWQEQQDALREQQATQIASEQQQQAVSGSTGQEQPGAPQEGPPLDSRADGVGWNLEDIGNELKSVAGGGLRDTASSFLTFPERMQDMVSGEMAQEQQEKGFYEPEFNPLGGDKDPRTYTWWGGFLRGGVHFGSMALAMVGIAKLGVAAGVGGAAGSVLSWIGGLGKGTTVLGNLARAGVAGAVTDAISEESHEANATGALKERFPWLDNPLATDNTDDPAMIYFKNIAEGLGTGFIADGLRMMIGRKLGAKQALGTAPPGKPEAELTADAIVNTDREIIEVRAIEQAKADLDRDLTKEAATKYFRDSNGQEFSSLPEIEQETLKYKFAKGKKRYEEWTSYQESAIDRTMRQADERSTSVENQIIEEGVRQVEVFEYGAFKDKPISDPWQAAPQSQPKTVYKAVQEKRALDNSWDPSQGSLDPITTPAQVRRSNEVVDVDGKELETIYKQLVGEAKFKRVMGELRTNKIDIKEFFAENYKSYKEFTEGRNTTDMTLDEYFAPIETQAKFQTGGDENYTAWAMKNVVIADLVNASNFKILRDNGVIGREIKDIADVFDVDGPMKIIADRLAYGIYNVKRSRYLISSEFRKLQTVQGGKASRKAYRERMASMHTESKEAVKTMMQVAQQTKSPELTEALLEAFSMSDKIQNWEDIWQYFNKKLKGGEWEGKVNTGMVVKELQGIMIHGVLSGPKTPMRAAMGTSTATFLRPMSQALGGLMMGDGAQIRRGLASTNAMLQAIPESWTLFKSRLQSYWAGDMSTIKTRNFQFDKADQDWKAMEEMIRIRKEQGESMDGMEAAYQLGNMARNMNNTNLLTYSTKLMAATDDAYKFIMARARAKDKAMVRVMELQKKGQITEITPELIKRYEETFYADLLDGDGNINFDADAVLKMATEEATLTRDLSGFAKGLETVFEKTPWAKPFLLFARTGVNGIEMTMKHLPGFNRLVKDSRRVLNATPDQIDAGMLKDVGIETLEDLMAAKAVMNGRITMGSSIVTMAGVSFMSGNITGNGPMDRRQRQLWIDTGWKPRSIKLGDVWVSYDAFEPFGQMLSYVADVGDNMNLMGEQWAEEKLQRLGLVLAQGTVSKSYLAGLQQFVDLLSGQPGQVEKMGAMLLNNQVPLSGLRNELGKLFNPYMKELRSGLGDSIRNRNQLTELTAGDNALPIKYDILNGNPINDWDFPTRMFNMLSPVHMSLMNSSGRTFLWNSGYDLRITGYNNPGGVNLKDAPDVRSMYQKAIGDQNLEAKLDVIAARPDMQESLALMERHRAQGRDDMEPMDYQHNKVIQKMFTDAQRKAWRAIADNPEVKRLIEVKKLQDAAAYNLTRGDSSLTIPQMEAADKLINMPIK